MELTDTELTEYIDVAFSNADRVGPKARHQLHGLLSYYAKKKHPFTACVRDNTKRFGQDRAERVCAVLKDIIRGTTHWRGKNNPNDHGVSPAALAEEFALDIDPITQMHLEDYLLSDELKLADVVWDPEMGFNDLRSQLDKALNEDYGSTTESGYVDYAMKYWVRDVDVKSNKAFVCEEGTKYYVVPFSVDKSGEVAVSDYEQWTQVEEKWVAANLADEPQLLAEMYFDGSEVKEEDGLIYKTLLREGNWKYSPGPNQKPIARPITVVKDGPSDGSKLIVSIGEIKSNFDVGAVEHVTIPETHDDKVSENTGFVRKMRVGQDEDGRTILEAGFDFTEPEIKEKVQRGTIANTSAGILFDYIRKEDGKKYNAVVAHAALTNHPWLTGMKPFGVTASENLRVVAFSEENNTHKTSGGDNVPTTPEDKDRGVETPKVEDSFLTKLGLSEDEVSARLSELENLRKESKRNAVKEQIRNWQEKGVVPAVLTAAEPFLLADNGVVALNLSQDGVDKQFTATQIVEALVNATPIVKLAEGAGTGEKDLSEGGRPADDTKDENEHADLSLAERSEIFNLVTYDRVSEEDAIAQVRARRKQ